MPNLYDLIDGKLSVNFHRGQMKAWDSAKRIVAIIAGGRSGKTSFAPIWLHREMRLKGPGDYLMVAPNYPLIDKAAGPEIEQFFGTMLKLGRMNHGPWQFLISPEGEQALWQKNPIRPSRILFGHADDPQSLEAMSAKAAWLDEAGQNRFKLESWEAVRQRVSLDSGRILITSKPYNLGWMKQLIHDPWEAAKGRHPEIDLIRFDSTENPSFPPEELERARLELPLWKYNMQYRGIFSRPAGLIYGSFDPKLHVMPRIGIPAEWPRFVGLDFGPVNTAAVFFAEERHGITPTGRLIAYREYKPGERSIAEHCHYLMQGDAQNPPEPRIPLCAGGAKSEDRWRREFGAGGTILLNGKEQRVHGIPIHGPGGTSNDAMVEIGINRVWKAFSLGQLIIFDDLHGVLDELASYSRALDDMGEPTEKIDHKEIYHFCDCLRYLLTYMNTDKPQQTGRGAGVARPGLAGLNPPVPQGMPQRRRSSGAAAGVASPGAFG